jgi:branched-chain amino acid transport system permease protein
MGVPVDKIISFTFGLGSALAAIAGVLYAMKAPGIEPLMGVQPGLRAFVAAVLGGIGNLPGAVLGGLTIGCVRSMSDQYLETRWTNTIVFCILVLILIFRPNGLLGSTRREKV